MEVGRISGAVRLLVLLRPASGPAPVGVASRRLFTALGGEEYG